MVAAIRAERTCPTPGCHRALRAHNRAGVCGYCTAQGVRRDRIPLEVPVWLGGERTVWPDGTVRRRPKARSNSAPRTESQGRAELQAAAQLEREACDDAGALMGPASTPPPRPRFSDSPRDNLLRAEGTVAALLSVVSDRRVRHHLLLAQLQLGMAENRLNQVDGQSRARALEDELAQTRADLDDMRGLLEVYRAKAGAPNDGGTDG